MRERTRGVLDPSFVCNASRDIDSPFNWVINFSLHHDGILEAIRDETGNGKRKYGNIYHVKYSSRWRHEPCTYYQYKVSGIETHVRSDRSRFILFCTLPVLTDISLEMQNEFNARAYESMKPSLEAGFSLANFLVELRDYPKMFNLWRSGNGVRKNLAGGYLNYQFGWKLFVRDCKELYEKIVNWEKMLSDYKSRQGKILTRHYKECIVNDTYDLETSGPETLDTKTSVKRKLYGYATMRYTYTVPGIDAEWARLKGFLDIFGLKLTPSVLWEALPYSFVVDWFLGVGEFLKSKEPDLLESVVTVLDYCITFKETLEYQCSWVYTDGPDNTWIDLGGSTDTNYIRRRVLPAANDFGITLAHRYGTKQICLSAALLLS